MNLLTKLKMRKIIMSKDWTGNNKSIYTCLGATNHSDNERETNDYYATEPKAIDVLFEGLEQDKIELNSKIWECAVGGGHLADRLCNKGFDVYCTDLYDRGYKGREYYEYGKSFFEYTENVMDIVTNPPYKYAAEFVEHAMDISKNGCKVIMFLKLTFLESKKRKELFKKYPPKRIYVSSSRLQCAKNGDFETYKKGTGTAVAYAWYLWEKGYNGDTIIRWVN